ncbi:FtsB family cell division protein [Schinkia azotoformans]|uniref:FtsB family cell division protein n=1 Tax=Schinkia azotoformans TaxID=1454 RepID=UPI002DC011AE|nr:septum formation initiator family protein [Schinkia azotoformans]MEC1717332.1 septum formation initiator family protein [Schinkia azotoformans]MEC1719942.1 septum formation initiator family protein [Schinkia azotoformans]MEC1741591.1 septum formation initiator family protein [Schinkia azotoformans]MEC1746990.1 septum formation initiator family protein [Schinkia azotoformans]MEC1758746.1 septum formation initiator family protein [Schinkia azotoformans]
MEPLRSRKITTLHSNYTHEQTEQQLEKKKKRRGLYRRLTLIALIALGISYCIGSMLHTQAEAAQEKIKEKIELEKKYASLKEQEKDHRAEIVKLNDDEYVAKLARNEYFLSEEGEIIFKLQNE